MASFYAELTVDGQTYPVRACQFSFSQAVGERGRVQAKVRHNLLHLTLDVPPDDGLLAWAATPFKAQAGHVTFFAADQRTARETVRFAAGQCVGYQESFAAGDAGAGAYACQLTIASPALTLAPGAAGGAYVPAAAREYAPPGAEVVIDAGQIAPELSRQAIRSHGPANPMNPERMKLWIGYLAKRGTQFFIGTSEAELKLYDNQAEGLFTVGSLGQIVYLHDPPSTVAFFEEAFHALQHLRKYPAVKTLDSGQEVDAWEYDAKVTLLKHSEKLGLSYEEYVETENQLQQVISNEYGNYNS